MFRFRLSETDACWFCGEPDSPLHTVFECARWEEYRSQAEAVVGTQLTPENICPTMLASKENWGAVANLIISILKAKEEYERALGR